MDLRLSPSAGSLINRPAAALPPVQRGAAPVAKDESQGFSTALKGALNSVSAAQSESARLAREVQLENPKVSLEETMVAIQKAQIGFQATLHVRNRMVQAYSDIMNMQV
ncbi:flagellar hook-basal body complex protein FliE [Pseudorhodoferax sp. Leaf267]|uniref:flagellar hook-basal body complex protein FliE n=1 Tax=Pseudorhodoferax sp. Leaf267 TaxID=1736316 RepID=UPI000700A6ED|nr:flagellar hook-basal body complex protein FliE [Pseudorhodoferax sp. Leaf267]KQP13781.1 flagellar hook-basal body protein FliE [Pseudorhodoferax sp. Leaf267]